MIQHTNKRHKRLLLLLSALLRVLVAVQRAEVVAARQVEVVAAQMWEQAGHNRRRQHTAFVPGGAPSVAPEP